ncbi:MAG: M23 family metallopeptidase [Puniceicoccales bacterium]|nr:M23 family metallopeptidase [Puniceicoccales bacterium]
MLSLSSVLFQSEGVADSLQLPTDNEEVQNILHYLQPTETGRRNGGFGLVRENGTRFHGGIDIRPVRFRSSGESADRVRAVADGVVVHANGDAKKSSYGKYIVVEHGSLSVPVFSLYAHLALVDESIAPGKSVSGGDLLGTMGRTSCDQDIPQDRAHLHFEMGLRLGEDPEFSSWYGRKYPDEPNFHGRWNGLNLVSLDPLPLLQNGKNCSLLARIQMEPTAFVTRICTEKVPEFLKRYPMLMDGGNEGSIGGFDVEWTWYGLPKRWVAIRADVRRSPMVSGPLLLHWERDWVALSLRMGTLEVGGEGSNSIRLGQRTLDAIGKIFGIASKELTERTLRIGESTANEG